MMTLFPYPLMRIGMIGGGQLGKMTAQIAKKMGFYITVLDPTPQCPAAQIADVHIIGSLYDAEKLKQLAQVSDVLTYEVEHVDTMTLKALEKNGVIIRPAPQLLEIIQDKLIQKQKLIQYGIPVPHFEQVDNLTREYLATVSFPIVQKARTGGYDGKGVVILKNINDADKILPTPSILEEYVDLDKELAVIVARSIHGEMACYPVVEMIFDDKTNICDIVAAPAHIDAQLATEATKIATQAIEKLEGVGVFGVEMFLTKQGQILVNEIAPRPHNSGHYTIEACVTCQFEQHLRAIAGLPLGATTLLIPAVMWNLLGEPEYQGQAMIEGLSEALEIAGLSFHFYGKQDTQPFRKMGHITIIDEKMEGALAKLQQVRDIIKIKARGTICK